MADSDLNVNVNVETKGVDGLSKLNSELNETETRAGKAGSVATGVFQGIGQAVAGAGIALAHAGIDAAIDAVGNSIELSSDKAEAASKVNVLFGESADTITAASENAATAVGLSSGAYLAAAGDVGNLITNLGFAGDEAADMSVDVVQLAADMGSFNNLPTEQAVSAIGAAFRGETEPIRAFGVMLNDATIKAKAAELGLYSGVGALDANAKAQATYQLILEGTTSAQGDFARTSDGLANSQKINAARMDEAFTRIGDALMPLVQTIMPVLADVMVGIAEGIGDLLEAVGAWVEDNQELVDSVVDLGRFLWDLYTKYIGALIEAFGELGYRVGGIIGLVIDLGGAIVDLGAAIIKVFSGDFAGAADDVDRMFVRLEGFQTNVQRAMGDASRRTADAALIQAETTAAANRKVWDELAMAAMNALAGIPPAAEESAARTGTALTTGAAGAIEAGAPAITAALDSALVDPAAEAAYQLGAAVPGEIGAGMANESRRVLDAADALRNILETGLTPEAAATEVIGRKYVRLVAQGMNSEIPGAKETAREVAVAAIDTIENAGLTGAKGTRGLAAIGRYYDELLASGLTAAEARAALAAGGVAEATIGALESKSATRSAWNAGDAIGTAWYQGVVDRLRADGTQAQIGRAAHAAMWAVQGHSPPKVGPLKEIDTWGENVAQAWVDGFAATMGGADVAGGLGRMATNLGPDVARGPGGGRPGGGGSNYYLTVNAGVGDPVEIGRQVVLAIGEFERSSGRAWRTAD